MSFLFHAMTCLIAALVPAVAGTVRFRKVERTFVPFLLLLLVGFITETLSFFIAAAYVNNAVVINVYLLVEALLLTWQFRRWGLFNRTKTHRWLYPILQIFFVLAWLWEVFVFSNIWVVNSYFILFSSFVILLMSLDKFAEQIVARHQRLWRNPIFWVCLGLVVFFAGSLITETFWVYGLTLSAVFRRNVQSVQVSINLLVSLFHTYAILWIPTRFRYLSPW